MAIGAGPRSASRPSWTVRGIVLMIAVLMIPLSGAVGGEEIEEATTLVEILTATPEARQAALAAGELRYDYGEFMTMEVPVRLVTALEENLEIEQRADLDLVRIWEGRAIDLTAPDPDIPSAYRIETYDGGVRAPYLIQFTGPMEPVFRTGLEDLGAEVMSDLGGFAVTARMTPAQATEVAGLSHVNHVAIFQPYHKTDPALIDRTGVLRIDLTLFPAADQVVFQDDLVGMGASVMDSYWDPYLSSVRITIDSGLLPYLAADTRVERIRGWDPVSTTSDRAGTLIHFTRDAWDGNRNGLGVPLDGYGIVVGIQDSGFDMGNAGAGNQGHPDFFGGCPGASGTSDRIIRYQARTTSAQQPDGNIGSQPIAHGTHISGIVAGNGYAWSEWNGFNPNDCNFERDSYAGQLPRGELSIDGVTTSTGGIASSSSYWVAEIADGARILSNSWGCSPCSSYGGTSSWVDNRIANTNPDLVVLFGSGNDGPGYCTGDNQNGGAKNGIQVSANENFRPEWFESDNPNLVPDFSSRGGPGCLGGRYKPDILGTGTSVWSTFGYGEWLRNVALGNSVPINGWSVLDVYDYTNPFPGGSIFGDGISDYQLMQGVSQACPMVAGGVGLIQQYLKDIVGIANPPNALLRAILINGAMRMDQIYEYPGYDQGFGRMNIADSLFPQAPRSNQMFAGTMVGTGTTDASTLTTIDGVTSANFNIVSSDTPLKVTLAWVDTSGSSINRNLDLRAIDPFGVEYRGNNYASGFSQPACGGCTYDTVNTIEQIEVESPFPGVWTVEIIRATMPSAAPFSLIFSADVGPVDSYDPVIEIDPEVPKTFQLLPGGSHLLPFKVTNHGSSFDYVDLTVTNLDPALTASFPLGSTLMLPPYDPLTGNGSVSTYLQIDASVVVPNGEDAFQLVAISQNDSVAPFASDTVDLTVNILDTPPPAQVQVTNSSSDEMDPSVVTFNDGLDNHIVIAYRGSTTNGYHVMAKHGILDPANGAVTWDPSAIDVTGSGMASDHPNDIRLIFIPTRNRVLITWTGCDPGEANADLCSWARSSYADSASSYGSWSAPATIQKNLGNDVQNTARVGFALDVEVVAGEVIYVWEHLDSPGGGADLSGVDSRYRVSTNGGTSWGGGGSITPVDGNYYFFPNGCTDQNGIAWVFFYWRTPTGNDRDLRVRLYDGAWQTGSGGTSDVWNTADNVQFPACTSTPEGAAGNRVYFVVTRDQAVDLKMYTDYIDGDFTGASPPADSANGWDSPGGPEGPFGSMVSKANYDRRPVLTIEGTDEGWMWLPYIEKDTIYNAPNIHAIVSEDAFASTQEKISTKDSLAKGHQMMDSLTIGFTSFVYTTFHQSIGKGIEVDYDIYLIHETNCGWGCIIDTYGPIAEGVSVLPAFVPQLSTAIVTANIDDITTGFSDIQAAQYRVIETGVGEVIPWTAMAAASIFNSPYEGVTAVLNASPLSVASHRVCVRGQDAMNNWGSETCTDFEVGTGVAAPPMADATRSSPLAGVAPLTVTLDATASTDPNGYGDIIAFNWLVTDRVAGSNTTIALTGDISQHVFHDPGSWLVNLTVIDSAGLSSNTSIYVNVSAFGIPIYPGPNLISFPIDWTDYDLRYGAGNRDIDSLIARDPQMVFNAIHTYRNGSWISYVPARPAYMNPLADVQLDESYALWIDVPFIGGFDETWDIEVFSDFTVQSHPILAGWNLVPYLRLDPCLSHDGGHPGVDLFARAISAYPYVEDMGVGAASLLAGSAYWVHTTSAGVVDFGSGC